MKTILVAISFLFSLLPSSLVKTSSMMWANLEADAIQFRAARHCTYRSRCLAYSSIHKRNLYHHKPHHLHLQSSPQIRCRTSTSLNSATAFVDIPKVITAVGAFYKSSPYTSAFFTCGVKASAADLLAQAQHLKQRRQNNLPRTAESENDLDQDGGIKKFDKRQNVAFLLYGGLYQGMFQEYMFNQIFPIWFGRGTGIQQVASKVIFILLVFAPFLTLPFAYITKALIFRYSFREALVRYWDDVKNHGLLKKFWALWGPVNFLAFAVVPDHMRITFMAVISFFWMVILSSVANRVKDTDEVQECLLVDGATCNIDG